MEGRDGIADVIYTWVEKTEIVIRAFSPPGWWRALLVWPREPCLDPRSAVCSCERLDRWTASICIYERAAMARVWECPLRCSRRERPR